MPRQTVKPVVTALRAIALPKSPDPRTQSRLTSAPGGVISRSAGVISVTGSAVNAGLWWAGISAGAPGANRVPLWTGRGAIVSPLWHRDAPQTMLWKLRHVNRGSGQGGAEAGVVPCRGALFSQSSGHGWNAAASVCPHRDGGGGEGRYHPWKEGHDRSHPEECTIKTRNKSCVYGLTSKWVLGTHWFYGRDMKISAIRCEVYGIISDILKAIVNTSTPWHTCSTLERTSHTYVIVFAYIIVYYRRILLDTPLLEFRMLL